MTYLEPLCRYITRPAIAEQRLSLTNQGKVRYELKTPYRDGTTHVIFEPVDFIAKDVCFGLRFQPVDATHSLNFSAGE